MKTSKPKRELNRIYHDDKGHFRKGNPGSPGNPNIRKMAEYIGAIREAVTGDDLKQVMSMLLKKAKEGDMIAAKTLLDRVAGKAGVAKQDDPLKIDLPTMATTKDTVDASNAILRAVAEGRLSPD